MILKCVKVVAAAAFALVSLNVSGQDLLARQAPIDRKLKAVDSVALIRQIRRKRQLILHLVSILIGGTSVDKAMGIMVLFLIHSVLILPVFVCRQDKQK